MLDQLNMPRTIVAVDTHWVAFLVFILTTLTACQITPVEPWNKDVLAQSAMQFDVTDMDLIMEDHFYFSKEGSSGGRGVSAGGCGCN